MFRALVGPTASGKTEAGIVLAEALGAEILSVDSMLVYRGMDLGTAKPTPSERARVPHHLLDLAEPSERFTVARFQEAARQVIERVERPLLIGGSGLYFRAVVDDLRFPPEDTEIRKELETEAATLGASRLYERLERTDPPAASRIEPGNVRRTVRALEVAALTGEPFSANAETWDHYDGARVRAAGIRIDRAVLAVRIRSRIDAMLRAGWIDEVRGLCAEGFGAWLTSSQAIGYAELAEHLGDRLPLDDAIERTVRRTTQLCRRQMAWFSKDPRIRWFDVGRGGAMDAVEAIRAYLEPA
jgi:tRNA dimethylallyltransferase